MIGLLFRRNLLHFLNESIATKVNKKVKVPQTTFQ